MHKKPALHIEQETAALMREAAETRRGDHPMTRHHHRNRVGPAGLPHRARGGRDFRGNLAVASRASFRNRRDRPPHALLEIRAFGFERQIEPVAGIGDIALKFAAGALGKRVARRKRLARRQ